MSKNYFKETVDVKSKRIWIGAMVLVSALSILGFFEKASLSDNLIGLTAMGFAILAVLMSIFIISRTKLKTKVTSKSINVRLSPFYRSKVKIPNSDIASYRLEKTEPFTIKTTKNFNSWFEKRFTLTGRNGVSITTLDGEHYFIGSTNPKALHKALKKACEE